MYQTVVFGQAATLPPPRGGNNTYFIQLSRLGVTGECIIIFYRQRGSGKEIRTYYSVPSIIRKTRASEGPLGDGSFKDVQPQVIR
jgi:hypothetical protein